MNNILEVTNLSIEYQQHKNKFLIVDRISLKIKKGEIFGIVGESGCGKSTMALAIAGLLPENISVTSGMVDYMGQDIMSLPYRKRLEYLGNEVGFIFQDPTTSLNPVIRIGNQIAEKLHLYSQMNVRQISARMSEVLEEVGLPNTDDFIKKYPHELSGGMRQRVMIAIAIINKPKLIIADEPTTSLDPTIQIQVLNLLKQISIKNKSTVILITHDFGVINQICDSVSVIYRGQIVESASTYELIKNHAHPYTTGLINSIPSFEKKGKPLTCIIGNPKSNINLKGCVFVDRCNEKIENCYTLSPNYVQIGKDHFSKCPVRVCLKNNVDVLSEV